MYNVMVPRKGVIYKQKMWSDLRMFQCILRVCMHCWFLYV